MIDDLIKNKNGRLKISLIISLSIILILSISGFAYIVLAAPTSVDFTIHHSGSGALVTQNNPLEIGESYHFNASWRGANQRIRFGNDSFPYSNCNTGSTAGCLAAIINLITNDSISAISSINGDAAIEGTVWNNTYPGLVDDDYTVRMNLIEGVANIYTLDKTIYITHNPSIISLDITPDPAGYLEIITCEASVHDIDEDDGDMDISGCYWYLNGVQMACANLACTTQAASPPTTANCTATLAPSVTLRAGDRLNCSMRIEDVHNTTSTLEFSSTITVQDIYKPAPAANFEALDVPGDFGGNISLSWDISSDDSSGADDVDHYVLLRSSDNISFNNFVNLSAGSYSYYDNNATKTAMNYYAIYAVDIADLSSNWTYSSARSNAISVVEYAKISFGSVECFARITDIDNESATPTYYNFRVIHFPPPEGEFHVNETGWQEMSCIYLGVGYDQFGVYHANATTECIAYLNESYYNKADKVQCIIRAGDGHENTTEVYANINGNFTGDITNFLVINNTEPFASNVVVDPQAPNESSTLYCNYTFNDRDGDSEDTSITGTKFQWFIKNEGANSAGQDNPFIPIPSQTSQTLDTIFDKDDMVMCAVLVKDLDTSYLDNSLYDKIWRYSESVPIVDNAAPQIIAYADDSNNLSDSPTEIGDFVTFNVTWVDYEDGPSETAKMFVCADTPIGESQYTGGSERLVIGDNASNDELITYFYNDEPGQYISSLAIKPYAYYEEGNPTYAPLSIFENKVIAGIPSPDFDNGWFLTAFHVNYSYYDADGNSFFNYGDTIVLENGTVNKIYDSLTDIVIRGHDLPYGTQLRNIGSDIMFYDSELDGFDSDDFVYMNNDAGTTVTVGDTRLGYVWDTSASNLRTNTKYMYDIIVYEVDSPGESTAGKTVIARDNDNSFLIGEYNYFTLQYNSQPLAGKYLAFKICIDTDNDDTCDSNNNNNVDAVFIHAGTAGTFDTTVNYNNTTFYDPEIKIDYTEPNAEGCLSGDSYCNTSVYTTNKDLSCQYPVEQSDPWRNIYGMKVCDDGGACSITRFGDFFVNHNPVIDDIEIQAVNYWFNNITNTTDLINTNFTDDANLFCNASFNDPDDDGHNVSVLYNWYYKRGASDFEKYNIPSNQILANGNTLVGDLWKCEAVPCDLYSCGPGVMSDSNVITQTAIPDMLPVILSVTDDSTQLSQTPEGSQVTFTINWTSAYSTQAKAYICNSTNIQDNGCGDLEYVRSNLSTDPITVTYNTKNSDDIENIYYVKICDDRWNCSNNYPSINQSNITFYVNHRPRADDVQIEQLYENVGWYFTFYCNYTFNNTPDSDSEQGTEIAWELDTGSGYNTISGQTSRTLGYTFTPGDKLRCKVKATDDQGLSDSQFRSSDEEIIYQPPQKPVVWMTPEVINTSSILLVGFINESNLNVTAYSRQGYLDPKVNSTLSEGESLYYGSAQVIDDFAAGNPYVVISGTGTVYFAENRAVQFSNHNLSYFMRYNITKKQNLFNGEYRLNISPNLNYSVPAGTIAHSYSPVGVNNSLKPTGYFNITLPLFSGSNDIHIMGKNINGTIYGLDVQRSIFVDTQPPSFNLSLIPSVTNSITPNIRFMINDDYKVNLSRLLVNITGTSTQHYSVLNSSYNFTNEIVQCSGDVENYSCSLSVPLSDGTYSLDFFIEDYIGNTNHTNITLIVDSSASDITVWDGFIYNGTLFFNTNIATDEILFANWSTNAVGIDHFEYKVEEYDGASFSKILKNWTDVGMQTSTNSTFNLSHNKIYYFVVRAELDDGGYSEEARSDGIVYYVSLPPQCPSSSCVHTERNWTNNQEIFFWWNFTSDVGISKYKVAVGSAKYPYPGWDAYEYEQDWASNTYLFENHTLEEGGNYTINVKAMGSNGVWSNWYSLSDPVRFDSVPPYGGYINYNQGYTTLDNVTVFYDDGLDNTSSIARRELKMAKTPLEQGSCTSQNVYQNIENNYSIGNAGPGSRIINLNNGYCYALVYTVTDQAGNSVDYPSGPVFKLKVDKTSPVAFTVLLNNGNLITASNIFNIDWSNSNDPESGLLKYSYALFENNQKIIGWNDSQISDASLSYPDPVHMRTYNAKVRAYNYANLSNYREVASNYVTYIDNTPLPTVDIISVEGDTTPGNDYLDLNDNNITNISVHGEPGMTCIASDYRIDYEDYTPTKSWYLTNCTKFNLTGSDNVTCLINTTDEGVYTRYIVCEDWAGNPQPAEDAKEVVWIVDDHGPNIVITSPLTNSRTGALIRFDANISDPMAVHKAWYNVRNSTNQTIDSGILPPDYSLNWDSTLYYPGQEENITYTIYTNDTIGRLSSSYINVTVDNIRPVLTFVMPNYDNRHLNGQNMTLNLTVQTFVNSSYWIYDSSGTLLQNNSLTNPAIVSYAWNDSFDMASLSNGNYSIVLWAVDEVGNENNVTFIFYIDRQPPKYSSMNITPTIIYNNDSVRLNVGWPNVFNQVANTCDLEKVIISHNANGSWINQTIFEIGDIFSLTLPAAWIDNREKIDWRSYAKDFADNWNSTPIMSFTVLNRPPYLNTTIDNRTWPQNSTTAIALNNHFKDPDLDSLNYSAVILPDQTVFYDSLDSSLTVSAVGNYSNISISTPLQAKYGLAVLVEKPTTNLLANSGFENSSSPLHNWTVMGIPTEVNTNVSSGNSSVMVNKNNYYTQIVDVDGNKTYALSEYMRSIAGTAHGRLHIEWLRGDLSSIGHTIICNPGTNCSFTPQLTVTFARYSVSVESPSQAEFAKVFIDSYNNTYILVDDVQLEESEYPTSYVEGSRGAGLFYYNSSELFLDNDKGTVEFWIRPSWNSTDSGTHTLFSAGNMEIFHESSNLTFVFGSSVVSTNISSWLVGSDHHIALSWSDTSKILRAYIDGIEVGNITHIGSMSLSGNRIYLGSDANGLNHADSVIDELVIFDTPRANVSADSSSIITANTVIGYTVNQITGQITFNSTNISWAGSERAIIYANDSTDLALSNPVSLTIKSGIPSVVLISPINDTDTVNFSDAAFTCNVSDDMADLLNLSLYSDFNGTWQVIETVNVSSSADSVTFGPYNIWPNGTFSNAEFIWNCLASDNLSNNRFAPANFTFNNFGLGTFNGTNISSVILNGSVNHGSYISPEFTNGKYLIWDNLTWSSSEPAGTNISIQVQLSNDSTVWTNLTAEDFTSPVILGGQAKSLRYKANLRTNNAAVTPILHTVKISYTDIDQIPLVVLDYPLDGDDMVDFSNVVFSCNLSDDDGLRNVTLYSDYNGSWHAVESIDLTGTGTSGTATFLPVQIHPTNALISAGYHYNCLVYDSINQSSFAAANASFSNWGFGTFNNIQIGSLKIATDNLSQYYPNGTYTSGIFDTDGILGGTYFVRWLDITSSSFVPALTNFVIETQTSDNNLTWSNWRVYNAPAGDIDNYAKYMRYRVTLFTNDTNATPIINDIMLDLSANYCDDVDADGYGIGALCTGQDCDDTNPSKTTYCGSPISYGSSGGGGGSRSYDCNDNKDNDGDGLCDFDGCTVQGVEYQPDPGCTSKYGTNEYDCVVKWSCSAWSQCGAGTQERECSDLNDCGTFADKPIETRSCVDEPVVDGGVCSDGIKNQEESDVDCGGPCDVCSLGLRCDENRDCSTTFCNQVSRVCELKPSCSDGVQNQKEEGIDCGGPCSACKSPSLEQPLADVSLMTYILIVLLVLTCLLAVFIYHKFRQEAVLLEETKESISDKNVAKDLPNKQQKLILGEMMILKELHKGTPVDKINELLIAKGWSPKILKNLLRMENFVNVMARKGKSADEIEKTLTKVGWPSAPVREAIKYSSKIDQPATKDKVIQGELMILKALQGKAHIEDIKRSIVGKGWPEDTVLKLVKLEFFIKKELSLGKPDIQIIDQLIKAGWPREVIEPAVKLFKK